MKRSRINRVSEKAYRRAVRFRTLRALVLVRANFHCEHCGRGGALDPHHVTKRSQGGPNTEDNVTALCRPCHDQTDAPFSKGRLCITALGAGKFRFEIIWAADKWEARR